MIFRREGKDANVLDDHIRYLIYKRSHADKIRSNSRRRCRWKMNMFEVMKRIQFFFIFWEEKFAFFEADPKISKFCKRSEQKKKIIKNLLLTFTHFFFCFIGFEFYSPLLLMPRLCMTVCPYTHKFKSLYFFKKIQVVPFQ